MKLMVKGIDVSVFAQNLNAFRVLLVKNINSVTFRTNHYFTKGTSDSEWVVF